MNLGRKIQEARIKAGMTQSGLAEAALTNQNTISAIERGVNNFAKEKLEFVVDYLDIDATQGEISRWHKSAHEPRKDLEKENKVEATLPKHAKVAEKESQENVVEKPASSKAISEIASLRNHIGFYQRVFAKLAEGDDSYRNGLIDAVKIYDELFEGVINDCN